MNCMHDGIEWILSGQLFEVVLGSCTTYKYIFSMKLFKYAAIWTLCLGINVSIILNSEKLILCNSLVQVKYFFYW